MKDIIIICVSAFFSRSTWCRKVRAKAAGRLMQRYRVLVGLERIRLRSFNKIELVGLSVEVPGTGIKGYVATAAIKISYKRLLKKKLKPVSLQLTGGQLTMQVPEKRTRHNAGGISAGTAVKRNYYQLLNRYVRRFFAMLPDDIQCTSVSVKLLRGEQSAGIIQGAFIDLSMEIDPSNKRDPSFRFRCTAKEVVFRHRVFSLLPVTFDKMEADINWHVDETSFTIGDDSFLMLNGLCLYLLAQHSFSEENIMSLALGVDNIAIADLLRSFPFILDGKMLQAAVRGSISFELMLAFKVHDPLFHSFSTNLLRDDVEIKHLGEPDLGYLQYPFVHDIAEEGIVIKKIPLDVSNPSYIPFDQIPAILINTIICTEDPRFYQHKGIDEQFLGLAIVTNIAERRFSRGGSTITMQVIRNLLLGHDKNISRKIEEMILACAAEGLFNIPKNRLLEIYMNIIELGPDTYGISEACDLYFGKPLSDLTVTECLILSYIIPRPKFFQPAVLQRSEVLDRNLTKHIQRFSRILFNKGHIGQEELDNVDRDLSFSKTPGGIFQLLQYSGVK